MKVSFRCREIGIRTVGVTEGAGAAKYPEVSKAVLGGGVPVTWGLRLVPEDASFGIAWMAVAFLAR